MNKFLPDMYQQNIYSINYQKLKKNKIKLLIFDFDNTIMDKEETNIDDKLINLFKELKKMFDIIIVSNTFKDEKITNFSNICKINYINKALKPLKKGYKKAKKIYSYKNNEIAMIGDQLLTDIFGAKKMNYFTILVDKIGKDDMNFTKVNRLIEKFLYKKLEKKFEFKRGKYYD